METQYAYVPSYMCTLNLYLTIPDYSDRINYYNHLPARWFHARLISDPENGGDTFHRNVASYADYTVI
jgi:hypothetical protein